MKKILVIENDIDNLNIVTYILEKSSFEIVQSRCLIPFKEVIELDPNLIILDYQLDNEFSDGFCLQIKSNPLTRHIPVLIYSACVIIEGILAKCHADFFIAKPFDITEFEDKVIEMAS